MNGNLTEEGFKFASLHISPQFTRAILSANSKDRCVGRELVTIAALMSVSQQLHYTADIDPFQLAKLKKKEGVIEGDHITFLNIFNKYNSMKSEN